MRPTSGRGETLARCGSTSTAASTARWSRRAPCRATRTRSRPGTAVGGGSRKDGTSTLRRTRTALGLAWLLVAMLLASPVSAQSFDYAMCIPGIPELAGRYPSDWEGRLDPRVRELVQWQRVIGGSALAYGWSEEPQILHVARWDGTDLYAKGVPHTYRGRPLAINYSKGDSPPPRAPTGLPRTGVPPLATLALLGLGLTALGWLGRAAPGRGRSPRTGTVASPSGRSPGSEAGAGSVRPASARPQGRRTASRVPPDRRPLRRARRR